MLVRATLTEAGVRLVSAGAVELRGTAQDAFGQHWSIRLMLQGNDGGMVATFLDPDAEPLFSREFEIKRGARVFARCTPTGE